MNILDTTGTIAAADATSVTVAATTVTATTSITVSTAIHATAGIITNANSLLLILRL